MFDLSHHATPPSSHIAAIDLGSNSFHMIIAHWQDGQLLFLDRLREPVRLGWGLQPDGTLDDSARERALNCLQKFGEYLREYPSRSVRIVGTKTLRSITDSRQFLDEARTLLGHPVEIISGDEEARLVYQGVAHCIAPGKGKRMVVDIGGGSTEIILGEGMQPLLKESLSMGCVSISKRFFGDGKITDKAIRKARIACLQELDPVIETFSGEGWKEVLGASGTIKAVAKVCACNGWSDGTIRVEYLQKIIDLYRDKGDTQLKLSGVSEDRQAVFIGGVVVLHTLFEGLQLREMQAADWALREGLLYDLKGRLENHDIRQASVEALARRFLVNMEKTEAVADTALTLLHQVDRCWNLNRKNAGKLLRWAAKLYAVGLGISHNDYHKHSAYIVENVDLAGYSRVEQLQLSQLVLAHRKRFPAKSFPMDDKALVRIAVLLRLALIFHRGRHGKQDIPVITLKPAEGVLRVQLATTWLEAHPLANADLETEARYLAEIGYQLVIEGA